jgi:hypothetical protein
MSPSRFDTGLLKGHKTMTRMNSTRRICSVAILGLSGMLVAASPQILSASDDTSNDRLAGAWTIQVTLRNCDTGAPMGSFLSLVSFHRGGTISETTSSPAFLPGQRSDGHGSWKYLGAQTYSQHIIALIRFGSPANLPGTPTFDPTKPVSPGFLAGSQTVTHRIRLTGEDTLESAGTNAFYDANGEVYRTGCSTAVGQRVE